MKKAFLGLSALGMLFAASCKKSDDNSTPSNSWKVGSTTYTASIVQYQAVSGFYQLSATSGNSTSANQITFDFNAAPTTGTYKVSDFSSTATNAVSFTTSGFNGTTPTSYESTGNDNVNATVTVSNGKVSITMPDATAKNGLSGTDSLKVSATNITQP